MSQRIFPEYTIVDKEPITICKQINGEAFDYPFFNEGAIALQGGNHIKKQYNLQEIELLDDSNLLEIKGFIFHTSHCGSTLLSRMLGISSKIRVISETEAINGLLLSYLLHNLPEKKVMTQLKIIIDAYRQPIGEEKYIIFKFTSWNVFMIRLFQKIYPSTKWTYIDRNTEDVVASLYKSDGGIQNWFYQPTDILRKHFIERSFTNTSKEKYLTHIVEQHRKQVKIYTNDNLCLLMYPEFIDKFETEILTHFNLQFSELELKDVKELMGFYSKSWEKKPYGKVKTVK
ncbi:hypothetical protein [Dokdonia sp.]|uniref:hypothetical protein n=1 Tax=Dokdonia sp. TaxID=2024995 RepID=UPI0032672477